MWSEEYEQEIDQKGCKAYDTSSEGDLDKPEEAGHTREDKVARSKRFQLPDGFSQGLGRGCAC